MSTRRLTIRLHARAGELAGVPEAVVTVDADARGGDVKRALALLHPEVAALVKSCALATDTEFLSDTADLGEMTRFHLVPPVSGG